MPQDKNIFLVVTDSYDPTRIDILAIDSNKKIVLNMTNFYRVSERTKIEQVEKFIEAVKGKRVYLADAQHCLQPIAGYLSHASEIVLSNIVCSTDPEEAAIDFIDKYL